MQIVARAFEAALVSAVLATAVTGVSVVQDTLTVPSPAEIAPMIARFAPADIGADVTGLAANERGALAKLVEAARVMDSLFLRQVWSGNDALLQQLAREAVAQPGSDAPARLHYFLINKGP